MLCKQGMYAVEIEFNNNNIIMRVCNKWIVIVLEEGN